MRLSCFFGSLRYLSMCLFVQLLPYHLKQATHLPLARIFTGRTIDLNNKSSTWIWTSTLICEHTETHSILLSFVLQTRCSHANALGSSLMRLRLWTPSRMEYQASFYVE